MTRQPVGGRIIALDVGEARIGVAVSDELGIAAYPLTVLDRRETEDCVSAILDLAREQRAVRIVVGMPLTLRGEEGPAAVRTREFVDALSAASRVPVDVWDERLTTRQAARAMAEDDQDERRRRGKVDKVAAALILQGYLDAARRRQSEPTPAPSNDRVGPET